MRHADTAWVLVSTALVMLMTPGLALFYGGMTRAKSVLNMMMMSFSTLALVSVLWVLYGYSIAFGESDSQLIGSLDNLGFHGLNGASVLSFAAFQLMFAIITPALISGAVADRAKFLGWCVFVVAWTTLVYFPVANWVFDFGVDGALGDDAGWIVEWGVQDFAGGTAVHVNAGAAALALALVLGRRIGWRRDPMRPHNLPLVLLGAGLLWFGWFGFNAGSALAADGLAVNALVATHLSAVGGMLAWLGVEKLKTGSATTLGGASGAIAGLVAITPAFGFLEPLPALLLGAIAGAVCLSAVQLKYTFGYDDSLDVVAVHFVGGVVGMLFIGLAASHGANPAIAHEGLLYGGGAWLLGRQAVAVIAAAAFAFIVSYLLATVLNKLMPLRVSEEHEHTGLDQALHAEAAYDLSSVRTMGRIH